MPKPNFIFIAADDLCQIDMLQRLVTGFRMPNYERLAASGTEFRRAYCAVPICEPARTAVMTGISPFATRSFDLNISWKDIVRPEHLWTYRLREGDEPYHMVTQGKIFHGYVAVPQSVYDVLYDDTRFGFSYTPSGVETVQNGGSHGTGYIGNEHQWYDHQVATRAINFLNSYAGAKPFWCEVGFQKPHTPFEAPQRCFEAVPLENVILPTEWQGGWDTVPFARTYMTDEKADEDPNPANWTEAKLDYIRLTIRSYAAAALFMDDQLGRVLDAPDFAVAATDTASTTARVRVIGVVENQAPTRALSADLPVRDGMVQAQGDICHIALVERHRGTGGVVNGFVSGFGYQGRMAIASTVAHDSHHMIVVGTCRDSMAAAANHLGQIGGGITVFRDGKELATVALPIAGLMSDRPADEVAQSAQSIVRAMQECGCQLNNAVMQHVLLALVVIPELRISDLGIVDVTQFKLVDLHGPNET